jgi:hypothetical protein
MVSGKAVPMAAKSEPVTPSEIFNLSPRCSRALVKISEAIKMMTKDIASWKNDSVIL